MTSQPADHLGEDEPVLTAEEMARQKRARDEYAREAAERLRQMPAGQLRVLQQSRARALAEFEREQQLAADPRWNRQ